jgi:surfeit locus 1 family protein
VIRKPSLFSLLLLLFGLAFFTMLGNWQLRRAHFKEQLLAGFNASAQAQRVELDSALARWPMESYVAVRTTGEFIAGKTVLLDSQTLSGQIGVQVYQGFRSQTGATVLVALGFMPIAPDRSRFPTPSTPIGRVTLTGLIAAPPASGIKLSELGPAPSTPTWLVTRIEPAHFSPFFGAALPDSVLLLDPSPAALSPLEPSAGSVLNLPRHWFPNTFPPERHRGYAMTWYGFALTAVIIFLLLHRKRHVKP